jgi:sentrin-specific protease 8
MSNKFLNYKRYDLSHTDAEILQRGGWLTSDILQFAFACLCNNDDGSLSHDRFGFLNPLTIMMLTHGDPETQASLVEDCAMISKELIFIPLNDADATNKSLRGTHWRLLVYCKRSSSFHLYDSNSKHSGGSDLGTQANGLVQCLSPFLVGTTSNSCHKVQETCPQQENGYDCGMYVVCVVEHLYLTFLSDTNVTLKSPSDAKDTIQEIVTQQKVSERRNFLYDRATELRNLSLSTTEDRGEKTTTT